MSGAKDNVFSSSTAFLPSCNSNNECAVYTNPVSNRFVLYINEPVVQSISYIILTFIFILSVCFASESLMKQLFTFYSFSKVEFISTSVCILLTWFYFLRLIAGGKLLSKKLKTETNLSKKTVVITGGNSGIGKETVLQLLEWNVCCCIIAARNMRKAQQFLDSLVRKNLIRHENQVRIWNLDLSKEDSIKHFCRKIHEEKININILINNAGIMRPKLPKHTNEKGVELHFATNHIGHFLLTNLLLENLKKNNSRVINVSSFAHSLCDFYTGFEFSEVINVNEDAYNASRYYAISKLANLWFSRELQKRFSLDKTEATVFSVHPGVIRTEITRDLETNFFYKIVIFILSFTVLKRADQGAATQLYLCAAPSSELHPGAYYAECRPMFVAPAAIFPEKEKELWLFSEKVLGIKKLNG